MRIRLAALTLIGRLSLAHAEPPGATPPADDSAPRTEQPTTLGPPGVVEPGSDDAPLQPEPEVRAPLLHPILAPAEPGGSRTPALVMTGVTLALVAATGLTYAHGVSIVGRTGTMQIGDGAVDEATANNRDGRHYMDIALGLGLTAIVSTAVTGYLWTRTEAPPRRILVHPHPGGATVGYGGSF